MCHSHSFTELERAVITRARVVTVSSSTTLSLGPFQLYFFVHTYVRKVVVHLDQHFCHFCVVRSSLIGDSHCPVKNWQIMPKANSAKFWFFAIWESLMSFCFRICATTSVTRLGDFWRFLVTNFLLKVAQMYGDFSGFLKSIPFDVKTAVATFLAGIRVIWTTVYYNIWSPWPRLNIGLHLTMKAINCPTTTRGLWVTLLLFYNWNDEMCLR